MPDASYSHQPVLLTPILEALGWADAPADGLWVDGTLGLAGHSLALLNALIALGKTPHWLGLDRDKEALALAQTRLEANLASVEYARVSLAHSPFSQLSAWLASHKPQQKITGGLLLDLGVSSLQLDKGERGFSFREEAPLDMRMNAESSTEPTAADLLDQWDTERLADCFWQYGEEKLSRPIARAIERYREAEGPLQTTSQLAKLVEQQYRQKGLWPPRGKRDKAPIHPATRVFQALRIAVNQELQELETLLGQLPELMASGARVAIISFHSLEDRVVKHYFQTAMKACICPPSWPICQCQQRPTFKSLSKKPITANPDEISQNPRARSAKLRIYQRL